MKNIVFIGNVKIGGNEIIAIQSMTNTDTADVNKTAEQILVLNEAGAKIVRITVNNEDSAKAVPYIIEKIRKKSDVPIVGDFHFNGHLLLKKFPSTAKILDKYRINPGTSNDKNFCEIIEIAIKNKKPVRIGVNAGSIDQKIFEEVQKKFAGENIQKILQESCIKSVLNAAALAQKIGLKKNQIVLSAKISDVQSVIYVNEILAKSGYALHLGLTEAGMGQMAIVSSVSALSILLQKKIGNTIRISLTPDGKNSRVQEVELCKMLLQSLGIKNFEPKIISCPGCGRTDNVFFQKLTKSINKKIKQKTESWKKEYKNIENLTIAVMGCTVNGPGESKHCNIGISLPGKSEKIIAPVYAKGKFIKNLSGNNLDDQFLEIVEQFIKK